MLLMALSRSVITGLKLLKMINFDHTPNNHDQQYFLAILEMLQLIVEKLDKLTIENLQEHTTGVSKKIYHSKKKTQEGG